MQAWVGKISSAAGGTLDPGLKARAEEWAARQAKAAHDLATVLEETGAAAPKE